MTLFHLSCCSPHPPSTEFSANPIRHPTPYHRSVLKNPSSTQSLQRGRTGARAWKKKKKLMLKCFKWIKHSVLLGLLFFSVNINHFAFWNPSANTKQFVFVFAHLKTNICLPSKYCLLGCAINRIIRQPVMKRIAGNYGKICFGI